MKYNPSRDIPKAVKQLKTTSPTDIRNWIRDHRTRKDPKTGRRVQHLVTPESITNWLRRNPKVHQELERYVEKQEIVEDGITEGIFQNGVFEKIPCINKWTNKMRGRGAKERSIKTFVSTIKQVCKGELPLKGTTSKSAQREIIEGWGLKHPARLTTEIAVNYIAEMRKRELKTRNHRLALRNFLKANNVEDWDEISGQLEQDAGKYAHLYAERDKLTKVFEYVEPLNKEVHDASFFSFKTASRLTATLTAHAKNYKEMRLPNGDIERTIIVEEKASLHKGKRRMEKVITDDLYEVLKPRLQKGGLLFNIDRKALHGILYSAYKEIIPELADEIPMVFHFWRHQFAQHLLRETGWNYGLVARLGGWTTQTLEKYYGKMDRKIVMEQGRKHIPNL